MKIKISELQKKHTGDQLGLKSAVQAALDSDGLIDDDGADVEEVDLDGVVLKKSAGGVPDWASELRQSFKALADKAAATEKELTDLKAKAARRSVVTGGDFRNDLKDTNLGFKSFGEMAQSVFNAKMAGRITDDRLLGALGGKAASTYAGTNSGPDGGFAVPPEYSGEINKYVGGDGSLLEQCDVMTVGGNTWTYITDETTPYGTSGIRAYWENEGSALTASKPVLQRNEMVLKKLTAFVPISNEMVEDSVQMTSYIPAKVGEVFNAKLNTSIFTGTGGPQMVGILNHASVVSQAKETSQTADTFNAANAAKMLSHVPADMRANLGWYIHPSVEAELPLMAHKAAGDNPFGYVSYSPPGANGTMRGMLLGIPVYVIQPLQQIGDAGDVVLANLKQYQVVKKSSGVKSDFSTHFYFDSDQSAFRFTFRVDGRPKWSDNYVTENDSYALSPFVTLDERS